MTKLFFRVSDQAKHSLKVLMRGLVEDELYYLFSKNKGADQLCSYCPFVQPLCFVTVTAQLICVFVFAYAKMWFSHDEAYVLSSKPVLHIACFTKHICTN